MTFFTKKRVVIVFIITTIVALAMALFSFLSRGAAEKITFADNESTLAVRSKYSPAQKLLKNPDLSQGDLAVTSQPDGILVNFVKVLSSDPLFYEERDMQSYDTPFSLSDLDPGEYWMYARTDDHDDFIEIIKIEAGKISELNIILKETPEEEKDIAIESTWEEETETQIKETEQYYQDHPLMSHIPYRTDNFEVHIPNDQDIYLIELFPTASKALEYPQYLYELRIYKKEALNWIESKGIDPNSLEIEWTPPE